MADTTFVPRVTTIVSTWLQAINDRIYKGRSPNFATTTGSANAQVLTLATGSLYIGATDGDTFQFVAGFTNTGATTLQVIQPSGTLAAVALQVSGQACVGGELQAGQTYTVVRLGSTWQLQSQGWGWVSVKDQGAAGNGSTDDTAAIQATIDSLTAGGVVYFPRGQYKITASLKFKVTGTILLGSGYGTRIVAHTTNQHGIENATGSRLFLCGVHNLGIENAAGITCGKGIYLLDMNDSSVFNVIVDANGHATAGFVEGVTVESSSGKGAYQNRFYGLNVVTKDGAGSIGIKLTGIASNGANSNSIYGGAVDVVTGTGIYILGTQNVISGVSIEGNMGTAVDIANDGAGSDGNVVAFNRIEGAITNGVRFAASTNASLSIGNMFSSGVTNRVVDSGDNSSFEIPATDRSMAWSPLKAVPVATASLPAAGSAQNGKLFIETITSPTGLNFIAYANSLRVRLLPPSGRNRYSTVPIGSVAYGSLGTDTVASGSGALYWCDVYIPRPITLTGVGVLNGTVAGGTDNYIVALYNSAGTLLANSALAGAAISGTDAFQQVPFTAVVDVVEPGRYWIGVQFNGTTDRIRTVAASTFIDVLTKTSAGVFGTITSFTPPTTFTANLGPIAYVY